MLFLGKDRNFTMKKLRLLSFILVVTMLVLATSALVACGDETTNNETTTPVVTTTGPDGETQLSSGVPDGLDYGDDVTWLIWSDHTMQEFYAEQLTGDEINDQIYDRNQKIEKQLGVTFKYVEEKGNSANIDNFKKKVEADFSGEGEYEIIGSYSVSLPTFAQLGFLADATEEGFKYFDFDREWWPNNLVEQATIGDSLYFFSGDISTNLIWMMTVMYYNKELAEEYQMPNLYDLVKNNEWTHEKLYELTKDIYTDANNNNKKDADDFYGLQIAGVNFDAFATSAEAYSVIKDAQTDLLKVSDEYYGEYMTNLIDMGVKLYSSRGTYYHTSTTTAIRAHFTEGQSIFWPDRTFVAARECQAEGVEIEFGVLPIPMYMSTQQKYVTNVGHPFTMYGISSNVLDAMDMEKVSAVVQEISFFNYQNVTPEIFDTSLKNRYADEPDDAAMFEICRNGIVFEMGRLCNNAIDTSASSGYRSTVVSGQNTWASLSARYKSIVDMKIQEFNKDYAALKNGK